MLEQASFGSLSDYHIIKEGSRLVLLAQSTCVGWSPTSPGLSPNHTLLGKVPEMLLLSVWALSHTEQNGRVFG